MHTREALANRVLLDALERRVFPGAVAEVGSSTGVMWRSACGHLSFDVDAPRASSTTLYDLASLTKPLATTSVALALVESGRLRLNDSPSRFCAEWTGAARAPVTMQQLLEHASGLSARLLDVPPDTRRDFEHDICTMPLEYEPGTRSIYSDLGFILLGFCLEVAGDASLASLTTNVVDALLDKGTPDAGEARLLASVPTGLVEQTASTAPLPEDRRRGRRLVGKVHDNYAAALGGFAGHAGLFGNVAGVGVAARVLLRALAGNGGPLPFTPSRVTQMVTPSAVPGSSRALGWDTMRPTSSCGRYLSPRAFGHVGFTGTSIWIDPTVDRYFVLLSNRVCDGGTSDDMQVVRRAFHEALTHP